MLKFMLVLFLFFCAFAPRSVLADESKPFITSDCLGNIETFDKNILTSGVSYKISYVVSGNSAQVRFAGREFDASVETGESWNGVWIKKMDDEAYFSFLPDDGGTIKFEFSSFALL